MQVPDPNSMYLDPQHWLWIVRCDGVQNVQYDPGPPTFLNIFTLSSPPLLPAPPPPPPPPPPAVTTDFLGLCTMFCGSFHRPDAAASPLAASAVRRDKEEGPGLRTGGVSASGSRRSGCRLTRLLVLGSCTKRGL